MFFDPRALFMLAVVIGVSGYVLRGLMLTWHRLNHDEKPASASAQETEERLRKLEAATSSLLVDVHGMREKERFMARLQAAAPPRDHPARSEQRKEGELSPLVTQNIPVIPRTGSY